MAEVVSASTPNVKKDQQVDPITPAAKEDYDATTPRESSDINSPPGTAGLSQQRKRKYEEATEEEKLALNTHHINNPHLKQRELAEWFRTEYGKSINQSTVSRNLKKFKSSPPSLPTGGTIVPDLTPTKHQRERKTHSSRSPPGKKIQINKQLRPLTPSAVSLPPTPPPRDNRTSPIDTALYDFYLSYRKQNPSASAEDCDRAIVTEARKLAAGVRPPPPPEKMDVPTIDDTWVANWKKVYQIPAPSSTMSAAAAAASSADRTSSEETEPRSPVSTVSTSDHESLELPPIRDSVNHGNNSSGSNNGSSNNNAVASPTGPNGQVELPENRRKRQIESLKKEIEKRERRIESDQKKRTTAQMKLEKLERAGKQ